MVISAVPLGVHSFFNAQAPQEGGLRGFLLFEPVGKALVFGDTERPWTLGTSHIQGSWGPRWDLALLGTILGPLGHFLVYRHTKKQVVERMVASVRFQKQSDFIPTD